MHRYAQDWHRAHFGLGPNTMVDSVYVRWPSGAEETFYGIPADQYLTLERACWWRLKLLSRPPNRKATVNLPMVVCCLSWEPTNCAEGYKLSSSVASDTVPYLQLSG